MSDLQCAATIIVARHGEAEYESDLLSDDGGSLTRLGREQARELGRSLVERRIAAVWCSDMSRAVQTAELAAGVLGCEVQVRTGVREFGVGDLAGRPLDDPAFLEVYEAWRRGDLGARPPGAESAAEVVERTRNVLSELADLYRGETTLVISHGGVMTAVLPMLARNVTDTFAWGNHVPNGGTCELDVDGDGWVMRTWRGEPIAGQVRGT